MTNRKKDSPEGQNGNNSIGAGDEIAFCIDMGYFIGAGASYHIIPVRMLLAGYSGLRKG